MKYQSLEAVQLTSKICPGDPDHTCGEMHRTRVKFNTFSASESAFPNAKIDPGFTVNDVTFHDVTSIKQITKNYPDGDGGNFKVKQFEITDTDGNVTTINCFLDNT